MGSRIPKPTASPSFPNTSMRRLGDQEPDSGHPTPRDFEFDADDGRHSPSCTCATSMTSESSLCTCTPTPLTSTPIAGGRRASSRHRSFDRYHTDRSRTFDVDAETEVLVESVKQLIQSTEENRRLKKRNEKMLNKTEMWKHEMWLLEEQIKQWKSAAESLQLQLHERNSKIEHLENELLRTITERPSEEGFEASEEMVTVMTDSASQYDSQYDEYVRSPSEGTMRADTSTQCEGDIVSSDDDQKTLVDVCTQCEDDIHEHIMARYKKERRELEDENDSLISLNKELKEKLEAAERLAKETGKERCVLEDQNRILEAEIAGFKSRMESMQDTVDNMIKERHELEDHIQLLLSDKKSLQDEVDGLRTAAESLSREYQEMEEQNRRLGDEINELKTQTDSLHYVVDTISKEHRDLQEENRLLTNENKRLRDQFDDLQTAVDSERQQLKDDKECLETENKELRSQVLDLQTAAETISKERQQLKDDKECLETENKELRSQVSELRTAAETISKERQDLEDRTQALDSENRELREELDSLRTATEMERQQLQERNELFDAENKELKSKVDDLQTAADSVSQRRQELEELARALDAENKELKTQLDSLRTAAATASKEKQEVNHQLRSLDEENKELKSQIESLQCSTCVISKDREDLQIENRLLDAKNTDLKNQLEVLEAELHNENLPFHLWWSFLCFDFLCFKEHEELQLQNRTLAAENEELKGKLDNLQIITEKTALLKQQVEQYQKQCSMLENENAAVKTDREELLRKSEEKSKRLDEVNECFERVNDELEHLRTERCNSIGIRVRNEELERLLIEKEKLLEEHRIQEAQLNRELEELKELDADLKRIVSEKAAEVEKLTEDCKKFEQMSSKLTEDNVFSTVLAEELKARIARYTKENDELRTSLEAEKQAREKAEDTGRKCGDLETELREKSLKIGELMASNEKMSEELEFLRQQIARNAANEVEQYVTALEKCRKDLDDALDEKEQLLKKQASYIDQIAKTESLQYELESREKTIADLRSLEFSLQESLSKKSTEIIELEQQLAGVVDECARIRHEFSIFQEVAEQQYSEKLEQIEALSQRLAQLEPYPGQNVSADQSLCENGEENAANPNTVDRALFDCLSPSIQQLVEKAAKETKTMAEALRAMRDTFISVSVAQNGPQLCIRENPRSPDEPQDAVTQTSDSALQMIGEPIPLRQLIESVEKFNDNHATPVTLVQSEFKRFLDYIAGQPTTNVVERAVQRFLDECNRQITEMETRIKQELKTVCEDKKVLEEKLASEKRKWNVERNDLQLELDRCKRQLERASKIVEESNAMKTEMKAGKIQIEQFMVKIRKQAEELESVLKERDDIAHMVMHFQKLDQESQEEVVKANATIDELEEALQKVRAELESERRDGIRLRDENDEKLLIVQRLRSQITGLESRVAELQRQCEKLTKTEAYNQETIAMVCKSFWEREDFVQRLKRRSYERKKLIEHFVRKVGEIISQFKGDDDAVNTMKATIDSWTVADIRDEHDQEAKEKALRARLQELGSGDQLDMAQKLCKRTA
ncbi:hypothetical protein Q1695_015897 [Nippostrongylus brasiliensis]|nr:hypothetical protein Q1695_015897 [Nippostrongylus brasiliensis]